MPKNFLKLPPYRQVGNAKVAIIGGSGLEDPKFFKKLKEIKIKTPFGFPSAPICLGVFFGRKILFLSRHGKGHSIPPHKVNSRANIWALKELGAERIIGISAVGSLQKNFKPGDIAICDQFIDFTKKRDCTFYDGSASSPRVGSENSPQVGVVHVSSADPFCPELRTLFYKEAKKFLPAGRQEKLFTHPGGTYLCIEGPRFSTRAESKFFRNFADVIGMTLIPEANLARELEICYLTLAMVTDYDVWQKHPVNFEEIIKTMGQNIEKIKKLLGVVIPKIKDKRTCFCKTALKNAKF